MKRETGYYWVNIERGSCKCWQVHFWNGKEFNTMLACDSISDINETRLMPPVEKTPEQIEQERIQKGRADYGVYS